LFIIDIKTITIAGSLMMAENLSQKTMKGTTPIKKALHLPNG
jgi:hypothetical protein